MEQDEIMIRRLIQRNGKELYERLGKTSINLKFLAGEILEGNKMRVLANTKSNQLLTIDNQDIIEHIIEHGFTKNQIVFLENVEELIKIKSLK